MCVAWRSSHPYTSTCTLASNLDAALSPSDYLCEENYTQTNFAGCLWDVTSSQLVITVAVHTNTSVHTCVCGGNHERQIRRQNWHTYWRSLLLLKWHLIKIDTRTRTRAVFSVYVLGGAVPKDGILVLGIFFGCRDKHVHTFTTSSRAETFTSTLRVAILTSGVTVSKRTCACAKCYERRYTNLKKKWNHWPAFGVNDNAF